MVGNGGGEPVGLVVPSNPRSACVHSMFLFFFSVFFLVFLSYFDSILYHELWEFGWIFFLMYQMIKWTTFASYYLTKIWKMILFGLIITVLSHGIYFAGFFSPIFVFAFYKTIWWNRLGWDYYYIHDHECWLDIGCGRLPGSINWDIWASLLCTEFFKYIDKW